MKHRLLLRTKTTSYLTPIDNQEQSLINRIKSSTNQKEELIELAKENYQNALIIFNSATLRKILTTGTDDEVIDTLTEIAISNTSTAELILKFFNEFHKNGYLDPATLKNITLYIEQMLDTEKQNIKRCN